MRLIDLTGQKFGRLTVVERVENKRRRSQWLCKCDCGNEVKVSSSGLRSGNTKSCSCLQKDLARDRLKTHGMSSNRIYNIWYGVIYRCENSNFINFDKYGGRGITVCDNWKKSFDNFYDWAVENGYDDSLEIDREDNDGNYCPENCRFVTHSLNQVNRGATSRNRSGYVGVCFDKSKGKWSSYICYYAKGKSEKVRLGRFHSKEAAVKARNNFIEDNKLQHRIQEIT